MTKAQTINNTNTQAQEAMLAYLDSIKKFEGIKTVCADVTDYTDEDGQYTVVIAWTADDGTHIDEMTNRGKWAGKALVNLAKIWKCEPDIDTIKTACLEDTAEVMFYVRKGISEKTGEPWEMQDFRQPNKIDRAHQRTADLANEQA